MKPTDAKHTSGPWRVVERAEQGTANGRRIVVQSPSSIIADCDWNSPVTNRANAELIASAPTLLAERDELRQQLDFATSEYHREKEERRDSQRQLDAARAEVTKLRSLLADQTKLVNNLAAALTPEHVAESINSLVRFQHDVRNALK